MKHGSRSGSPRHAVSLAHRVAGSVLREGDLAVDATAGNGHDTVFLARAVGAAGKVFAIDLQSAAIEATRARLDAEGLSGRVVLRCGGHERLGTLLNEVDPGRVTVVMLNLGYLPGGDKTRITRPATTLSGLNEALRLLAPGGVLTVVCYPGHPGGGEEAREVRAWASALDAEPFRTFEDGATGRSKTAPFLVAVKKNPDS